MSDYLKIDNRNPIYPYTVSDSWGGEACLTKESLEKLYEEIKKALDKQEEK